MTFAARLVPPLLIVAAFMFARAPFLIRDTPLETTMEGELGKLLDVVKEMNLEMVRIGAPNVISQVKIYYDPAGGSSMDRLLEKYPRP